MESVFQRIEKHLDLLSTFEENLVDFKGYVDLIQKKISEKEEKVSELDKEYEKLETIRRDRDRLLADTIFCEAKSDSPKKTSNEELVALAAESNDMECLMIKNAEEKEKLVQELGEMKFFFGISKRVYQENVDDEKFSEDRKKRAKTSDETVA